MSQLVLSVDASCVVVVPPSWPLLLLLPPSGDATVVPHAIQTRDEITRRSLVMSVVRVPPAHGDNTPITLDEGEIESYFQTQNDAPPGLCCCPAAARPGRCCERGSPVVHEHVRVRDRAR